MNEMDPWNKDWDFPEGQWPDNFRESLREFFATEDQRPAGLDVYDDCFRSPLFFPLQRKRELIKMIQLTRKVVGEPRTVLEVGADKGAGFYHWVKCFPSVQRAIAIEVRGTPYGDVFEQHFPAVTFLWLAESSYDPATVERVASFLTRAEDQLRMPLDVIFIDGDKANTIRDCEAYLPLLSPGGLLFIHDVVDEPGVAFQKLAHTHKTELIVDVSESREAMGRARQGMPIDSPYEEWLRHWEGQSATVGVVYPVDDENVDALPPELGCDLCLEAWPDDQIEECGKCGTVFCMRCGSLAHARCTKCLE
jgi:hypothetical protein